VTPTGREAHWFHNVVLVPLITAISVFVLILLLGVMFFFSRARNKTPSKTAHNTTIEIIWTLAPVLILIAIAVPSIRLLAAQFKPAPKEAITLKAIGNQWFWSYEYPDNGGIQLTANMLKEQSQVRPASATAPMPMAPACLRSTSASCCRWACRSAWSPLPRT
jgi:cytochrome c oxidase subunit 2